MSNTFFKANGLSVTAFVGKNCDRSVQFSIGGYPSMSVQLTAAQVKDLAMGLIYRTELKTGFTSTGIDGGLGMAERWEEANCPDDNETEKSITRGK